MPPRAAPKGSARGGRGGSTSLDISSLPSSHVNTIGVKRPSFGTSGRESTILVNSFRTTIPDGIINHYDVILPSEKIYPARVNMQLIHKLQTVVAPEVFTPRAVYDGRKNLFANHELPLGPSNTKEFSISISTNPTDAHPGKFVKVRLTKVAVINPETLQRFIAAKQSTENSVLTAITALNVVIRMQPSLDYPFNVRSFFTNAETKDIGGGLELWRGFFQSVRPALNKMLINVDISTGTMYKGGSFINLCLAFFGRSDPNILDPTKGMPDRERLRLQRFVAGMRILVTSHGPNGDIQTPRIVKKLSAAGANALTFTMREGQSTTVANYFKNIQNKPLRYPGLLCVVVGNDSLIPVELCQVPEGQIMRKQIPPHKTREVLEFATRKPADRLNSIRNSLQVLQYGKSEYVRSFGMTVDPDIVSVKARILVPPKLRYGPGSKDLTVQPANGAWNMVNKRFYKPADSKTYKDWMIVCFESERRFNVRMMKELQVGLTSACRDVGINLQETPYTYFKNAQAKVSDSLKAAGQSMIQSLKRPPTLIVAILPEGGNDIYNSIKYFGDVTLGVATQCLKSSKCIRAKSQYFANVCLKINVKLGGINTVPDSASELTDPRQPTIIMGADVVHPAPGSGGRPSFTALVGNVDSSTAKYVAESRVQTSRQEMIDDIQPMAKNILSKYMGYRSTEEKKPDPAPRRLIFYRDGVSEGQFQQVLDIELPALKRACADLKITPKITVVVVGKRHHVRFFPSSSQNADKSGNCPAGTVVDREISHPTEFDFYLQSHGGLLGTSRPAHYSVLYDENKFTADSLQSLSFALCHVYARSTRSVSIPAPVYYADIVCARARTHYDPGAPFDFSDSGATSNETGNGAEESLEAYRRGFRDVHVIQAKRMYFS